MDFIYEDNRVFCEGPQGNLLAEITFPEVSEGVVDINHTFVDDSLRGQGIAGQLLFAAAEKLRTENKKAVLTCSYAIKWFEKNPAYADVLLKKD